MPTPVITSIFPPYGPVLTPVEVTGTDLGSVVAAEIGGFITGVTQVQPTSLHLVIPANFTSGTITLLTAQGVPSSNAFPFILASVAPLPEQVGWTISWQQDFGSWTGEHSKVPDMYLTRGQDTYRHQEAFLQKQSQTTFNNPDQELELQVVVNSDPLQQKSFDTLILDQDVVYRPYQDQGNPRIPYAGFNSLSAQTAYQHTGNLTVRYPATYTDKWAAYGDPALVVADRVKDDHHLELPGSATLDPEQALDSPDNQDQTLPFKPRLSGKWALVTLTWDLDTSPTDLKLVLHTLRVITRTIPR